MHCVTGQQYPARRYTEVDRSWHRKQVSDSGSVTVIAPGCTLPTCAWISSRVGGLPPRSPALGSNTRQRCCAIGMQTRVRPSGRTNRCVESSLPTQSRCDVGEQQVPRVRLAGEGQAELVPHPAVRAVAADDETGADLRLPAVGVAERSVTPSPSW